MAVFTVSRGSASGGLLLAEGLAERLGYELLSRETIIEEATKQGASEEKLQKAILKPLGFLERFRHERRRYLAFVQQALCERAVKDNLIYHGNAGHLLLRGITHVVCIRLIAPLSNRTQIVMEREDLSYDKALNQIEKMDRQRRDWTHYLYGVDWLDPGLYDLTLNLETLKIEGAVEIASLLAKRPEFATTSASRKAMDNLLLASRVRAALARDETTAPTEVEVTADDGLVRLRGRVRPASAVDSIIRVTREVEGVGRIDRAGLGAPELTV